MSNTLYIQIRDSGPPTKVPRPSRQESVRTDRPSDSLRRQCPARTTATCWEILFAIFGSLLCSFYALHHETTGVSHFSSVVQTQLRGIGHFSFLLDPSPALMLGSCLIIGCAISSFAYRRQEQDRYQSLILVLAITSSTIFGLALGINAVFIMLGLVPWTLCAAMLLSVVVHWAVRRCHRGVHAEIYCCEIGKKGISPSIP